MKKVLIIYFSQAGEVYNVGTVEVGNTEIMAHNIADILREREFAVDMFKVEPVTPYPLEYQPLIELAQKELETQARPEFKGEAPKASEYDAVFIGYPIWWGELPMIVYSVLEQMDLKDVHVIPFNTHEGSGEAGTYEKLKNKFPEAKVRTGLAIMGRAAREEKTLEHLRDWLDEIK